MGMFDWLGELDPTDVAAIAAGVSGLFGDDGENVTKQYPTFNPVLAPLADPIARATHGLLTAPLNQTRVAGFSPDQLTAMGGIRNMNMDPGLNLATMTGAGLIGNAYQGPGSMFQNAMLSSVSPGALMMAGDPMGLQYYESPYASMVRDRALSEYDRAAGAQRARGEAARAGSRAFGTRGQLARQDQEEDLARQRMNLDTQLLEQGFQNAAGLRQQDRSYYGALAGLANQQQASAIAGAGALSNIEMNRRNQALREMDALNRSGTLQQGYMQQLYDTDFFNRETLPWSRINNAMGILNSGGTAATQVSPPRSFFQNALGGGLLGYGLATGNMGGLNAFNQVPGTRTAADGGVLRAYANGGLLGETEDQELMLGAPVNSSFYRDINDVTSRRGDKSQFTMAVIKKALQAGKITPTQAKILMQRAGASAAENAGLARDEAGPDAARLPVPRPAVVESPREAVRPDVGAGPANTGPALARPRFQTAGLSLGLQTPGGTPLVPPPQPQPKVEPISPLRAMMEEMPGGAARNVGVVPRPDEEEEQPPLAVAERGAAAANADVPPRPGALSLDERGVAAANAGVPPQARNVEPAPMSRPALAPDERGVAAANAGIVPEGGALSGGDPIEQAAEKIADQSGAEPGTPAYFERAMQAAAELRQMAKQQGIHPAVLAGAAILGSPGSAGLGGAIEKAVGTVANYQQGQMDRRDKLNLGATNTELAALKFRDEQKAALAAKDAELTLKYNELAVKARELGMKSENERNLAASFGPDWKTNPAALAKWDAMIMAKSGPAQFERQADKNLADRVNDDFKLMTEEGRAARTQLRALDTAKQVLPYIKSTGPIVGQALQTVQGLAEALGVDAETLGYDLGSSAPGALFQSLASRMLISASGGLGNQISNADRDKYEQQFFSLSRSPEANALIIDWLTAEAQKKAAKLDFLNQKQASMTQGEFVQQFATLEKEFNDTYTADLDAEKNFIKFINDQELDAYSDIRTGIEDFAENGSLTQPKNKGSLALRIQQAKTKGWITDGQAEELAGLVRRGGAR